MSGEMSSSAATICNGCGAELTTWLPSVLDPQSRERFAIKRCQSCGLGHTDPQPAEIAHYYGPSYYGARHGFTAAYCTARRLYFLRKMLGRGGGRALLDVGCGDGSFLQAARQDGWSVFGTELAPELACSAGIEVEATIERLEPRAPFACITFWHSLEHMADPKGAIVAAAKLLAPDSVLLVAVPDSDGLQARLFGARWFHLDVPRHLFHFGRGSLTALLENGGLQVVRRWHQELELDLLGWSQSALNCVLSEPNVLFNLLTGKRTGGGLTQLSASLLLGAALTTAALPALPLGRLLGRGGTVVMAARPR
jgi:SAM-dependent methyltransferase